MYLEDGSNLKSLLSTTFDYIKNVIFRRHHCIIETYSFVNSNRENSYIQLLCKILCLLERSRRNFPTILKCLILSLIGINPNLGQSIRSSTRLAEISSQFKVFSVREVDLRDKFSHQILLVRFPIWLFNPFLWPGEVHSIKGEKIHNELLKGPFRNVCDRNSAVNCRPGNIADPVAGILPCH